MNTIDITGVDLQRFAQKVYELSVPRGLGFLHAVGGGLSDDDAADIVSRSETFNIALSMDYVHGRGCKMTVWREVVDGAERLTISDAWYDHSDDDLASLLSTFKIQAPSAAEGGAQ